MKSLQFCSSSDVLEGAVVERSVSTSWVPRLSSWSKVVFFTRGVPEPGQVWNKFGSSVVL